MGRVLGKIKIKIEQNSVFFAVSQKMLSFGTWHCGVGFGELFGAILVEYIWIGGVNSAFYIFLHLSYVCQIWFLSEYVYGVTLSLLVGHGDELLLFFLLLLNFFRLLFFFLSIEVQIEVIIHFVAKILRFEGCNLSFLFFALLVGD